jgi:hypothetical protein
LFTPFILFYFWAARDERQLQERGLLGRALAGPRTRTLHRSRRETLQEMR